MILLKARRTCVVQNPNSKIKCRGGSLQLGCSYVCSNCFLDKAAFNCPSANVVRRTGSRFVSGYAVLERLMVGVWRTVHLLRGIAVVVIACPLVFHKISNRCLVLSVSKPFPGLLEQSGDDQREAYGSPQSLTIRLSGSGRDRMTRGVNAMT
jgi:hypothetical protein